MNKSIEQTLTRMRQHERIPIPTRRAQTRTRLLESFGGTRLFVFQTRMGWIGIAWTLQGVISLNLPRGSRSDAVAALHRDFPTGHFDSHVPDRIKRELSEYAEGKRHVFDLPLDWSLIKPFQRAVLIAATKIPFGETRTYGWVAKQIGKPQAARAVGRALATNPIPLILPCHRVVGSDGSLTGYGGGLPLKKKLLEMEARSGFA